MKAVVDIHSHILYGIDDGSQSFDQSVAMLEMAAGAGTTDIVATPHCNDEFEYDPPRNAGMIAELQAAVGSKIKIHAGCDFHLSLRNVRQALQDPARFTINQHQYMLAEFSDVMIFEGVTNLFDQLIRAGVRPIITHPERNSHLQQRLPDLRRWTDQGCFLQITAHSYLGLFGSAAKNFAHTLTAEGLAHIVASDAHDLTRRTPRLDEAYAHLQSQYGEDVARMLCLENPQAVLHGYHLSSAASGGGGGSSYSAKKPWYRFW